MPREEKEVVIFPKKEEMEIILVTIELRLLYDLQIQKYVCPRLIEQAGKKYSVKNAVLVFVELIHDYFTRGPFKEINCLIKRDFYDQLVRIINAIIHDNKIAFRVEEALLKDIE